MGGMRLLCSVLIVAFATAACGRSGPGAVSAPAAPPVAAEAPVPLYNGTLWLAAGGYLAAVPLQPGGSAGSMTFSDGSVTGMAFEPDGTTYVLLHPSHGGWQLNVYRRGSRTPERVVTGPESPLGVFKVPDGLDVATVSVSAEDGVYASGTVLVSTYRTVPGGKFVAVRTLQLPNRISAIAGDSLGAIYVVQNEGEAMQWTTAIDIYAPKATCACQRTGTTPRFHQAGVSDLAVGSDGTIYALLHGAVPQFDYVTAFRPAEGYWRDVASISTRLDGFYGMAVSADGVVYWLRNGIELHDIQSAFFTASSPRVSLPPGLGGASLVWVGPAFF